jgi:tetratricopeptide (TPR) repeat protein
MLAAPAAAQDRRWLLDRARSEQRLYRIASAERLYRQILAHAPQDSEALSGLGELDLLRGTVDLADQHFQAALDANSNYIPALIAAADIRWQSGRSEEARQQYLDIVDHYSADSYPPYVALRSVPAATPVCATPAAAAAEK